MKRYTRYERSVNKRRNAERGPVHLGGDQDDLTGVSSFTLLTNSAICILHVDRSGSRLPSKSRKGPSTVVGASINATLRIYVQYNRKRIRVRNSGPKRRRLGGYSIRLSSRDSKHRLPGPTHGHQPQTGALKGHTNALLVQVMSRICCQLPKVRCGQPLHSVQELQELQCGAAKLNGHWWSRSCCCGRKMTPHSTVLSRDMSESCLRCHYCCHYRPPRSEARRW